jgi:Ca-activated chloride channel family protein
MITLTYPWLLLLLPLPLLVRWLAPARQESRRGLAVPDLRRFAELSGLKPGTGAVILRQAIAQRIGAWVAWTLLLVAVARPQWIGDALTKTVPTRDLLLAVDLSGSMQTEDFTDAAGKKTDRLTAVKQVLDDFLARRAGDRAGLIVFGNAPFVQAPFTDDLDVCRTLLDEAQVGMAGPRTMLGDAIGLAINVFEHSTVKDRVLILLTDGNDTGSKVPPADAARIAHDKGIVIHTVAAGDPTAAGEEKIDEEALRTVALTTGGGYYRAENREALAQIYTRLDALETRKVETLSHRPKRDLFQWPLGVVVVLGLLYHAGFVCRHLLRARSLAAAMKPASASGRVVAVAAGLGALGEFHFLRPLWLLALVPAVALFALMRRLRDEDGRWKHIIAPHLLKHLMVGGPSRRRFTPAHLMLLVWVVGTFALAGPTGEREPSPFTRDAAALMIAVEVTPTMLAKDVQPSRLERTAYKIHDLLAERPGASAGLIAYAGSAHLVMPPTRDASIVETFARELSPRIMPAEGDAAGEAVALANRQLEASGLPGSILLITDGVPDDQLTLLREERGRGGAPVHLLAMAAPEDAPVPPDSPPAAPLDRDALGRVADAGGGSLTVVTADDSDVRRLKGVLETRFKPARDDVGSDRWRDAGYWLVPFLLLLTLVWFRPGWTVDYA